MGAEQPLFLHEDVLPAIPSGWHWSRSDSLVVQLKPGKLFDSKTVVASGAVPVLNQSESGALGYHNEEPGVVASASAPVVTFANHTCAMRLVRHPFSAIQNIFPKVGRQAVCDTVWFYYALLGRVRTNEYKGHHPLFRDAFVPVPPIAVQRRIASILSAYDDLIENNTRRIAILEEMARRIYEEWFVRFRFPGHEGVRMVESELGLVPEGWQCGAFTELADVLSGGTPKKAEPEFWGGGIPFFTPTDAPKTAYVLDTEAHITEAGLARCASQLYPKDTVFITARGTVGKLALAAGDMAMNQSCYALKSRSGYGQVFLYLTTQGVVSELKAKSHGAVFDTIIMDTFRLMRIVKPPIELATRLESLVRPLFALSLTLSRKNANLRTTRDLLLPKLISGELDVSSLPEAEARAA